MNDLLCLLSIFFNLCIVTNFIIQKISISRSQNQRQYTKARKRLKKHIDQRKKLIKACRLKIEEFESNKAKSSKKYFGYPWWGFLKGTGCSIVGEKFSKIKKNNTNDYTNKNFPK